MMLSLKEKVSDKLSRLLSDSPSAPSSPVSVNSPVALPESEDQPASKVETTGPASDTFSSLINSFRPIIGSGFDLYRSNKTTTKPNTSASLLSSSSWKSIHSRWRESSVCRSVEFGHENGDHESRGCVNTENFAERNVDLHDSFQETTKMGNTSSSNSAYKNLPNLTDESAFISPDLLEFLHLSLPNIVKGCQWVLLYSTLKHGISLRTLLRKSWELSGPCLLIAGDMDGAIFGGILDCPIKPSTNRKYQGTNQTFVFTTIYGEPRLFKATGANRFYYLCLDDSLAFGGGGSFALYLDGDLLNGSSGPSATFGNDCLAYKPDFMLKNVELWGFTHLMRYTV